MEKDYQKKAQKIFNINPSLDFVDFWDFDKLHSVLFENKNGTAVYIDGL